MKLDLEVAGPRTPEALASVGYVHTNIVSIILIDTLHAKLPRNYSDILESHCLSQEAR